MISLKALASFLGVLVAGPVSAAGLPSEVAFTTAPGDAAVERVFTVTNTASSSVTVALLVTCTCLSVDPPSLTLPPHGSARVRARYDPADSEGARNAILVRIRGGENADRMIPVTVARSRPSPSAGGACQMCNQLEKQFQEAVASPSFRPRVSMLYYFSADCGTCTVFLQSEIPRLERLLGIEIALDLRDISESANVTEIEQVLAGRGMKLGALPVIVGRGIALQGEKEIRDRLAPALLLATSSRRQ